MALGDDLHQVWDAPTTTDKDRKQLLRTLLGEISITVHRDQTDGRADLVLHWKGGAVSDLSVPLKRKSTTGSTAPPPADCHTPPVESSRCVTTGRSPATSPAASPTKESCST